MKLIVFSDLHIHNYKRFSIDNSRLFNTLDVLSSVFQLADKENIESILFCGDLFDKQKTIPTVVINETSECFQSLFNEYDNINLYCITGNHDLGTRTSLDEGYVSALQHLSIVFKQFIVLDFDHVVLEDVVISGIPYLQSRNEFSKALDKVHEDTDILLIHQTPDEFIDGELTVNDERFNKFKHVFSGHIHKYKRYTPKFTMVGSPLHRDLGDEGDEKFILLYDTDTKLVEQVSTVGLYPEFKRGQHKDDGHYWIEQIDSVDDADELDYDFSTSMSPADLITNYYKQLQLDDELLLKIGLKCVK